MSTAYTITPQIRSQLTAALSNPDNVTAAAILGSVTAAMVHTGGTRALIACAQLICEQIQERIGITKIKQMFPDGRAEIAVDRDGVQVNADDYMHIPIVREQIRAIRFLAAYLAGDHDAQRAHAAADETGGASLLHFLAATFRNLPKDPQP